MAAIIDIKNKWSENSQCLLMMVIPLANGSGDFPYQTIIHTWVHLLCFPNPTGRYGRVQLPSGLVYSTWEMSKGTFWLSSKNVISNLDKMKATLRSLGTSTIQHCWDSRQRCVWHLIVRRRDAELWKQLNSFFSIMLQTIQWFVPVLCTALWNQV